MNAGNLANAGIYIAEPEILKHVPNGQTADFGRDIFPSLLKMGRTIKAFQLSGTVIGIDTPELHARLESYLSARKSTR